MQVSQIDARTVRVRTPGVGFRLPYRLWWNGHERRPESIVVRTARGASDVRAFFLFATVRDLVTADGDGVTVRRSWSIASPEPARLSIDVAFEPVDGSRGAGDAGYLLPGAASAGRLGEVPLQVPGVRTAVPSAACLFLGVQGIAAWVMEASAPTSITVLRSSPGEEDEPSLPCIQASLGEPALPSANLEATCVLRMLFAPSCRAALRASAVVVQHGRRDGSSVAPKFDPGAIRSAIERCLSTHLVREGGVVALRETPGASLVSAEAGARMAVLLRRLCPGDAERSELALRLADFSLRAQHPSGLFYESFGLAKAAWAGAAGKAPEPLVSAAQSARVADCLYELAELLEAEGRPADKYRIAAQRAVDFFFDAKGTFHLPGALHRPGNRECAEPGLAGLELFFPLARTWRRTGRDRYRKGLSVISAELARMPWGTTWLPCSREGREPDSAGALLCARIVAEASALSLDPVDGPAVAAVLAPWIYVGEREAIEEVDPVGALVDSFHRQRLLCAGAETSLALRRLIPLCSGEAWLARALDGLARLCQSLAERVPLGTSWLTHDPGSSSAAGRKAGQPSRVGPIDSRRLVREAAAMLALAALAPRRASDPRSGPRERTRRRLL